MRKIKRLGMRILGNCWHSFPSDFASVDSLILKTATAADVVVANERRGNPDGRLLRFRRRDWPNFRLRKSFWRNLFGRRLRFCFVAVVVVGVVAVEGRAARGRVHRVVQRTRKYISL